MAKPFEIDPKSDIELTLSPHGTYTIFDLPPTAMHAAEKIVDGLRARAFKVRFLQGEDRPDGMTAPYGIWPHPDQDAIELMRQESGMEIVRSEASLAALGELAVKST